MSRWLHQRRGRCAGQAGFTLIEMLVALAMGLVVMGAVVTFSSGVYRDATNETERSTALTEETTGVAGMVQLIDQAYHVNGPTSGTTSNYMDVEVRIPTSSGGYTDTRVLFNCAVAGTAANDSSGYNTCVRYEVAGACGTGCTPGTAPTGTGVTAVTVVKRLIDGTTGNPVFTNLATPSGSGSEITFGDATIDTPSAGERAGSSTYSHQVVLTNSFYIRNLDFGR